MKIRLAFVSACLLIGCSATTSTLEWEARVDDAPDRPSPAPAPSPPLSGKPALPELLRLALARNPSVLAARERALAAGESAVVEGWLPDPKLMLGWYETPVETRVGPQEFSLGIQQNIPFPSKLAAKSRLSRTLARRAAVAYERAVRDVLVEVVQAAHELAYLDEATEISARIAKLLERYTAAAAKDPLRELFRAETQRAQLENDRVLLAELRAAEAERLRALLDQPPDVAIGTPRIAVTPSVRATYEALLETARAHNHELKEAGLSLEAAAWRSTLARRQRRPDLTIGYTHIFTDGLAVTPAPTGNGDDPQIFWLGLSLPLWAHRNRAEIRRAEALERAAAGEKRGAWLKLRGRLARVWFRVGNAGRLVRLYEETLLPRAQRAARTAEELHAAGRGTLAGALETIAVLHNFRLAAARARADHGQAVAELEALLGQPLTVLGGETR